MLDSPEDQTKLQKILKEFHRSVLTYNTSVDSLIDLLFMGFASLLVKNWNHSLIKCSYRSSCYTFFRKLREGGGGGFGEGRKLWDVISSTPLTSLAVMQHALSGKCCHVKNISCFSEGESQKDQIMWAE